MHLLSTIAALSAAVASVNAAKAIINNNCDFDTWVWPTDTTRRSPAAQKISAGGSWSEQYYTPAEGGVSLKLSKTSSCDNPAQFEYTLTSGAYPNIWYDMSLIDCIASGCWTSEYNVLVETSKSSCPTAFCGANTALCAKFYNKPDDDHATLACDPTADVILNLCYSNGTDTGATQTTAKASPTAAPTSSKAAATTSKSKWHTMEGLVVTKTTFAKVAVRTAEPEPEPNHFEAHAHARRHMHGRRPL